MHQHWFLRSRVVAAALAAMILPASMAMAAVTAVRMTAENVAELQQHGPDRWGGIGDWALSNGTLRAVISNVDHESDLSAKGGVLVDLGYVGRADDQFVSAQDLFGGSRKAPVEPDVIAAATGDGLASITARGWSHGIYSETRYTLRDDVPDRLFVSKLFRRVDDDARDFGVLTPVTFNYQSMETFVLSSTDPSKSNGFVQEEFSQRGPKSFDSAARDADTIVMLAPPDSSVPIAYGWRLVAATRVDTDGSKTTLPRFALVDWGAAAFLVPTDDFLFGSGDKVGLLQLLQLARMGLGVGSEIRIEEEILVGRRGDVAAITDKLYAEAPRVTASVTDANVVLHVDRNDGTPFTHVRPDADGGVSFHVPPGAYALRIVAPGGRVRSQDFTVGETDLTLGRLTVGEPARIRPPRGTAMRLEFRGTNGTSDPDFEDNLTGFAVKDDDGTFRRPAVSALFLTGTERDPEAVVVPPGNYRVFATAGIEFSLEKADVEVAAGETVDLRIDAPKRVVETPGYVAADLHVHSGPSMDNAFSTVERVRTFVAEHGEVMVAAEHETVFDFGPLVREMGVADRMVAVVGHEATSEVPHPRVPHTIGHANFFPIEASPYEYRSGIPANEGRRMREVLAHFRDRYPDAVAQLNHPRYSLTLSGPVDDFEDKIHNHAYFDHMGPAAHPYDPARPLSSSPNHTLIEPDPVTGIRDLDVDAMEIMNGPQQHLPDAVAANRRDWISFLRQGVRIAGTANSDSHGKHQQVALPRNMVAMADDRIAAFDLREFAAAIKAGRLYGTTGPLLEVDLSGTAMGGTYRGSEGRLAVRVLAAEWIGTHRVHVFVNGEPARDVAVPADGRVETDLAFPRDSFVHVEVESTGSEDYATIYPGFTPYAFSNPIYVDADGDGVWTAPGL